MGSNPTRWTPADRFRTVLDLMLITAVHTDRNRMPAYAEGIASFVGKRTASLNPLTST